MTGVLRKAVEKWREFEENLRFKDPTLTNLHYQARVDKDLETLEWRERQEQMQEDIARHNEEVLKAALTNRNNLNYGLGGTIGVNPNNLYCDGNEIGDIRYKDPKKKPKATSEQAQEAIESNDIYSRAKAAILKAQEKQVAYGLDKYPEPLTATTWTMLETFDHLIDESIDKLHYLVMLRVKMEDLANAELEELKSAYETAGYTSETTRKDDAESLFESYVMGGADMDGDVAYSNEPLILSLTEGRDIHESAEYTCDGSTLIKVVLSSEGTDEILRQVKAWEESNK